MFLRWAQKFCLSNNIFVSISLLSFVTPSDKHKKPKNVSHETIFLLT